MNYIIDQSYSFTVLENDARDEFFELEVDMPSGKSSVRLPKLNFQKLPEYKIPSSLVCRVKNINAEGYPVLTHVVAPYVFELYEEVYTKGESIECQVLFVPTNPAEEPYRICDKNGIFFALFDPDGILSKGQIIHVKFSRLTPTRFTIVRVDEGVKLPYYSLKNILDATGSRPLLRTFIRNHIITDSAIPGISKEIHDMNAIWVINAARSIIRSLPEWFIRSNLRRHHQSYHLLLETLRSALLYLLEGSGFLNAASTESQRSFREELTKMVEGIEPYQRTLNILNNGNQDVFVEGILDKLQKSGYLYHPAKQFAILMLIFRIHPEMVVIYLNRIFESIFGRDLENWKREPFRSAFVEQFEIYVCQARKQIDRLPVAELREQKARVETVILAIAMQLLLTGDDEKRSRSLSLFYRYISLLRPVKAEALLSKSFLALLDADINTPLSFSQLKEPMMMMTRATVMPDGDFLGLVPSTHCYSNGVADITISPEGITISLTHRRDITEQVIPDGFMPWLRPKIKLNGIRGLSGPRLRQLSEHNIWWHDIEAQFEPGQTPVETTPATTDRAVRRAEKGDDNVYITIQPGTDYFDNNPTFRCDIASSDYLEGWGILKRDQVVGYNLKQVPATTFQDARRRPLYFRAKVLDERADGSYIFSLRDEVDEYIEKVYNFEDEFAAIITGINEYDLSALSREGVGLFLNRSSVGEDDNYKVGDVVRCRMTRLGKQGQLHADIIGLSPQDYFDKNMAFATLMHSIGEEEEDENSDDDGLMRDFDEILSPDTLREVLEIIRFRAIAESDLIKAYDYLRFARLMALIIGDTSLADRFGTHAALLSLHQYYATNSRLDPEKLVELKDTAESDPFLKQLYHRLEMVSWLDRPEQSDALYRTVKDADGTGELERSIAKLVLSYNILKSADNIDNADIASGIKKQIMNKLNVNSETKPGKYYGSESKFLEFKTSLVYPAVGPGEDMVEDPEKQQFHILSRIAGMLNADGGRLYLGVNNDGFEIGLKNDFKFYERHQVSVGHYRTSIRNIDNLCVFLENLIDYYFDKETARKIDVFSDPEAEKGVIILDIKQSLKPVYLEGHLFVRQSGQSTREYHGEVAEAFIREREELKAEHDRQLADALKKNEVPQPDLTPEAADVKEKAPETVAAASSSSDSEEDTCSVIPTSAWIPNVLHDYEDAFVEPLGYLYFNSSNTVQFSETDLYKEPGFNGCGQALAVPHHLAEGYLILGFDNERALRIPVSEVIEKANGREAEINNQYKLMFAAVAGADDMLICVGADGSDNLWKRACRISQIEQGHLNNLPKRLHDAPIDHTFSYEIADESKSDKFADCMSDRLSAKRFGATLRVKPSLPRFKDTMANFVADCAKQQ